MMDVKTFKFINLDYMDMMSDNDPEMKKTMLEMLFEEVPEEMDKMKALFEAENWQELSEVSHKMKSTLAFVGNPEMTTANSKIEKVVKDNSEITSEMFAAEIATLMQLYPLVLEELKSVHQGI